MAGKSKKPRGLGRGLDALFADQAPVIPESRESEQTLSDGDQAVLYIDINEIKPNVNQPRKNFDPQKINELADSIREHGIIQPLVVRSKGAGYEIVAGERRYRAAREAGLSQVPCLVREFSDEENMLIAIIENMQREDLNPIEEAQGLNEMIRAYGMTQEDVSKSVSKSRPYITNALRLLKLPQEMQTMLAEGKMSTGHARALLSIKDKARQEAVCHKITEQGISVREAERLAKAPEKPEKKPAPRKDEDVLRVEEELKELYGTKVSIHQKGKKGSIEIEYYDPGDLNRLIDILRTVQRQ
jgi:ParB family chromosome partitioning protein